MTTIIVEIQIIIRIWDHGVLLDDKSVEKGECSKTAYDSENNAPSMNPNANPQEVDIKRPCDISNIPLQKWVHIGIVLSNRTLSVFMDGKLSRSCVLKNVPKVVDGKLYLFQNDGFNGKISDFMYVNYALVLLISMLNIKKDMMRWI